MSIKITQAAIEAGVLAMRTLATGLTPFEMARAIIEAALPHLQDCKVSPQTVQSPPATATQVAIDDAEVERVARVMATVYAGRDEWDDTGEGMKNMYRIMARAAIRAIREGGQRWGVWDIELRTWVGEGRADIFVTHEKNVAEWLVRQCESWYERGFEVLPYPGERAKTAEEIAIGELQDIADNGLRCDTNPTIQITTSANDTAMRYAKYIELVDATMRDRAAKALAAIRDAKENSNG